MLQLQNTSPFKTELLGFPDRDGVDTLYVVVKATFVLTNTGVQLADEQLAVTLADEYRGPPRTSSLVAASEAHITKPGTDVVVVGDACALDETPVSHLDVGVGVADRQLHARVHGDRYWTEGLGGIRPSRGKPFVRTPVIYERAYGGQHTPDETTTTFLADPRNPVGCGFLGKRSAKELLGQPAPTIEDLQTPIGAPGARGTPAIGFGPIAPNWEPRILHSGTYDEAWKKTRMPYLPLDFDPRFFNIAAKPLVFAYPLSGGEPVAISGFHPRGMQRFDLPRCELNVEATIGSPLGSTTETLPYHLETVAIEPTIERFSLTFRGALRVDKDMLRVQRVQVSMTSLQGLASQSKSA